MEACSLATTASPLSALAGAHGLVLGFEPVSRNVQYSRLTAAANNLSNVQIKHACMSNQTTTSMQPQQSGEEVGGQGAVEPQARANPRTRARIDDVVVVQMTGLVSSRHRGAEVEALKAAGI